MISRRRATADQSVSRHRWGLARQLVLLQVALVLVACVVAVGVSIWQARADVTRETGRRCLAIAEALAGTPWVAEQIGTHNPTGALQPFALGVQADTGVDFITIMNDRGIRFTHPDPSEIGGFYLGTTGPALAGGTVVETYTGTLGSSVRAVVPIRARGGGPVIALVAVGVRVEALGPEIASRLGVIAAVGGALLALALLGTWLIGRRMNHQTRGLRADELGLMHTYYDAVLESVREGMLLLDRHGTIQLMNAEARRLLKVTDDPVGRPVSALGLPAGVAGALAGSEPVVDSVQVARDRVLVVSAMPARTPGPAPGTAKTVGRVITLRDHTELTELASELGMARDLSAALGSQSHESANRLHAVITLVELGRGREAVEFATSEFRLAQRLTDQLVTAIAEPVIAAVLLGKAQVAAERGIDFDVTPDSALDSDVLTDVGMTTRETVTVLGNLIDNAFDAVGRQPIQAPRRVRVTIRRTHPDADGMLILVADSGPGLDQDTVAQAFRRGWSTKSDDGALHGHGLGLALVEQVVDRHGGRITVEDAAVPAGAVGPDRAVGGIAADGAAGPAAPDGTASRAGSACPDLPGHPERGGATFRVEFGDAGRTPDVRGAISVQSG